MLEINNISKNFGGIKALSGLNFEVNKGEIVGLIGPNGSGKTTLFNVISGIYRPDGGTLTFEGKRIDGTTPAAIAKSGIGRTFQLVQPFPEMTTCENVMVASMYGRKGLNRLSEAKKDALTYLEFSGLSEKKDVNAGRLTMGERRRLEIARALALDPKLLLLDECVAGLNPTETVEAIQLIKEIRDKLGITIFMVEHVMKVVMELSERIIVLNYGEKIAEGTPEDISKRKEVIEAYLGEAYVKGS